MQRAEEPVEEPTGAAPDPASDPRMRLVEVKRTVRRPPGGRLLLAGFVLAALVAAGAGFVVGPDAEESLVSEASAALRADKVKGVRLQADGPFVTAYVPTRVDPRKVEAVVGEVGGVSGVASETVYSTKKEAQACTDLDRKLDRVTGRQRIPFPGGSTQLTSSGRGMVVAAARLVTACGSARVYVGGHTDSHTPNGSTLTLRRARVMIDLMRRSGTPEERLVPRGYGAQYEITDGDSGAAQSRNQRGSITLVEG